MDRVAEDVLFSGDGEMARIMRDRDWSATSLGPVPKWPHSLKVAVRIMLTSRQPFWIGWGEELLFLYNDAYKRIVGGKHPDALGRPTRAVWPEIWDVIGPMLTTAMAGGDGTYIESQRFIMERHGYPEETYYTFSYSPVLDDGGVPGGIICANTDDTRRVIGERQMALLRELAAGMADARTVVDACTRAARSLEANPLDLPFALLYRIEPGHRRAVLAGAAGVPAERPAALESIALDDRAAWPIAEALGDHHVRLVSDLDRRFDGAPPAGAWHRPPRHAAVLPIAPPGSSENAGALVVGLNPFRVFDDDYRRFLELVAAQLAAGTANARAYEEERRRAEQLAELDRAKTHFFTSVSHEFRTPLTLMLGPIEEMLARPEIVGGGNDGNCDGGAAARDDRKSLEVVHHQSQRLLKLVNALLDFSRIEAGRMRAVYRPVDVAALTAELASMFRSAVEQAGMRLVVDCPQVAAPVFLDREMWEKIVLNLLSNAFKFTFEGEIEVRLGQVGETIELAVRDTGVGIPARALPHIFERFHRIEESRRRSHEGTGIGVALVQELTKLHGGTVRVDSAEGVGTTFTVSVPIGSVHLPPGHVEETGPRDPDLYRGRDRGRAAPALEVYAEEARRWLPDRRDGAGRSSGAGACPEAPHPSVSGPRPRIVLADDNADMRAYVLGLLAPRFDVEDVPDGGAALEAARRRRPDLVLTDAMMPGIDGFELLRRIRADAELRDLPVIVLSARAGEESRIDGVQAGADDYLVKPFSAQELLARVSAQLALARIRSAAEASVRASEARLRLGLAAARMVAWQWNVAEDRVGATDNLGELFGLPPGAPLETSVQWFALVHPDDRKRYRETVAKAIEERGAYVSQFRLVRPDNGAVLWVEERGQAVEPAARDSVQLVGVVMDVTERTRNEMLLTEQIRILEHVAEGRPLEECLTMLTGAVGDLAPRARAAVLMADEIREKISRTFARDIPSSFGHGIEDAPISDLAIGTCGTAMYRGAPVACGDMAHDERWSRPWRDLCLAHGMRACHSEPIKNADGQAVASLMICFGEPRSPTEWERRLIAFGTHVARIVIERQRRMEALRASKQRTRDSEERLQTALAHSDTGTFRWAPRTGRFLEFDENLKRLFGFAPNEPVRATEDFLRVVHPDDLEELTARISRCRDGADFEMEYRVILPHGGVRWLYDRAKMTRDAAGELLWLVGSCTDVTRRKAAEEALRDSERRFRLIANSIPQMAWMVRPDGHAYWFNQRWFDYTGTAPAEMEGWGWRSVHDPKVLPRMLEAYRASIRSGEPFDMVFPLRGKDGTFRSFLTRMVPLRDDEGRVLHWFGTNTDVTEIEAMQEGLRDAHRRKDEFLAMLAHELRNPLAPIRNSVQIMRLADGNREAIDRARQTIERQLGQLVRLVDDLMDVGRVTRDKLELKRERAALSNIVRCAVESSQPLIESLGHHFTAALPREDVWVDADVARLAQVVTNLLNNAAKYTPPGGRIHLSAEARDGEAVVRVRDDGIGIAPDMLPRVFDLFVQAAGPGDRAQGGLGIGLALVKRLIEMHGGSVIGTSAGLGQGSEFEVRLPLVARGEAARLNGEADGRAAREAPAAGRVLVVDDNIDSAMSLGTLLRLLGGDVRTANDGPSGLKEAVDFRPGIAFLDIGMPGMSGHELARAIRQRPDLRGMVLVALTGWGQIEDQERSRAAGFDHHLTKPADPDVLKDLLDSLDLDALPA